MRLCVDVLRAILCRYVFFCVLDISFPVCLQCHGISQRRQTFTVLHCAVDPMYTCVCHRNQDWDDGSLVSGPWCSCRTCPLDLLFHYCAIFSVNAFLRIQFAVASFPVRRTALFRFPEQKNWTQNVDEPSAPVKPLPTPWGAQ